MAHLTPCTTCARHVRASDTACPFCGARVAAPFERLPKPPRRMGRSALAAWGAAFAFTAACGGTEPAPAYGGPPDEELYSPADEAESDVESPETTGEEVVTPDEEPTPDEQEEEMPVPAYGGPPPEAD